MQYFFNTEGKIQSINHLADDGSDEGEEDKGFNLD